jgi:hypothetical protein
LLNFKKNRPRGVVDTSVLVAGIAAFRDSGAQSLVPSAHLLRDWIDNSTFTWLINEEIVDEYKAILARRGVRSSLIGAAINLIRSQVATFRPIPATSRSAFVRRRETQTSS